MALALVKALNALEWAELLPQVDITQQKGAELDVVKAFFTNANLHKPSDLADLLQVSDLEEAGETESRLASILTSSPEPHSDDDENAVEDPDRDATFLLSLSAKAARTTIGLGTWGGGSNRRTITPGSRINMTLTVRVEP